MLKKEEEEKEKQRKNTFYISYFEIREEDNIP